MENFGVYEAIESLQKPHDKLLASMYIYTVCMHGITRIHCCFVCSPLNVILSIGKQVAKLQAVYMATAADISLVTAHLHGYQ